VIRAAGAPLVRSEVYGEGDPALDDPAELFHEASKLQPALARRQSAGILRLEANDALRAAAARAIRRNPQRRTIPLPPPRRPPCTLWSAIDRRRSRRTFRGSLADAELAAVLDAGYGVRDRSRRTVPSGGALYPLELYVALRGRGVYRYDPELHHLEEHDVEDPWPMLASASPLPSLLDDAAAAVLVLAVFGRTRFKYGQRGYRFALLEAGHVVQNVVLAAAALDVVALPFGGYYDARVDDVVGADGVEESVVYAVVLG
jgi:SagB-type dehydrogenase family enzyme